jgi:hypothetical protein
MKYYYYYYYYVDLIVIDIEKYDSIIIKLIHI